jgi:hypothetical protein
MEVVSELETWIQIALVLGALSLIVGLGAIVWAFANRSFPAENTAENTDNQHEGFGAVLDNHSWAVDDEDRYDGQILPTGVTTAAIASRWRLLREGESNYARSIDFALAMGGSFHSHR